MQMSVMIFQNIKGKIPFEHKIYLDNIELEAKYWVEINMILNYHNKPIFYFFEVTLNLAAEFLLLIHSNKSHQDRH